MEVSYAESFFKSDKVKVFAKAYLKRLPPDVDTLLSRGSSGCAIATAMICLSDRLLNHVYIRKEHENSHGSYTAGAFGDDGKCAIVDDFINSGETIAEILKVMAGYTALTVNCIIVHHCSPSRKDLINRISDAISYSAKIKLYAIQ